MNVETGDLWEYAQRNYSIIVPTNIGWKANGTAVMGAGVAAEASRRYSWLTTQYGTICRNYGAATPVFFHTLEGDSAYTSEAFGSLPQKGLFTFPTKGLVAESPNLSWQQPSSLALIERSLNQLVTRFPSVWRIAMPLVGTGHGGLPEKDVLALLETYLGNSNIVVVRRPPGAINSADEV